MKGKSAIILFWVLLMIPALVLGGAAFRLLSLEQERFRQSGITALEEQARAIAGEADLAISTLQDNLTRTLVAMGKNESAGQDRTGELSGQLQDWERKDPLIRNVFVYLPSAGLVFPDPATASTREERQFISRFRPLFTGQIQFTFNKSKKDESTPARRAAQGQPLLALSRQAAPALGLNAAETGWIPWFSENRLHILGWVRNAPDGPVYGVELELMTFLSRLVIQFPKISRPGIALALFDGNAQPLVHSGPLDITDEGKAPTAVVSLPVSACLPHWSIRIFVDRQAFTSGRPFLILALLLVGILFTAIISGGILITRLTLEKIRDARQKTSFVSSVSHELKTPLTSIRMYAELLLSKRVADPDKQAAYLSVIVTESQRLTRLINNVLDFGRLEQGKKSYNRQVFDLTRFLEALIQTHQVRIQQTGLEVITAFSCPDCRVCLDRDAMEQVVLNILDNVIKYAGTGGAVTFTLKKQRHEIHLTVKDQGPGIPDHLREKIFERFYRADRSLTATQPGSGLGLSIARQMIRDQGGDLVLDASTGPGASFTIRIPYE